MSNLSKQLPRVLVGCPTSELKSYCLEEYIKGLKSLTYKNFDILIVDNSKDESYVKKIKSFGVPVIKSDYFKYAKDRVIKSRNILRKYVLEKGYDYFLSLEQDVIAPVNIIEGLLRHGKKIISGVVYHMFPKKGVLEEKPLLAVNSVSKPGKLAFLSSKQIENINALIEIDYCCMGCLLIHRSVLEKIKFRYEEYEEANKNNPEDVRWDDMCFCKDVKELGYNIYADLGAKCRHLILKGYNIALEDMSKVRVELIPREIKIDDIMNKK